jgi:ribosomal protein S8
MKSQKYSFFISFISAYRSNKPYLVVAESATAYQCLPLLCSYGLISSWGRLSDFPLAKKLAAAPPIKKSHYLIVWFNLKLPTFNELNQKPALVECSSARPLVKNNTSSIKISLLWKPSQKSNRYISHKQLKKLLSKWNVILFLDSKWGIISSHEALKAKLGGFPIFAIYLLSFLNFTIWLYIAQKITEETKTY